MERCDSKRRNRKRLEGANFQATFLYTESSLFLWLAVNRRIRLDSLTINLDVDVTIDVRCLIGGCLRAGP